MKTILISGARAPIALEMARSFKLNGHHVIMMDCQTLTIARWSNAVGKYYTIPSPRFNKEGFIKTLQHIIKIEKVDHLIPTCEEAIFIAAYKDEIPCNVWTVNHDLMINLHNKYFFSQQFSSYLPIPKTVLVSDFNDWENSEKYVFKPVYSRFGSSVIIKKNLQSSYFKEKAKLHWVAQQFISGKEVCVYSIWDKGTLKAFAAYHPLLRAGKGAGIFFEPVQNKIVFDYVKRFGEEINYHGQLSFDVIIDQNQQPYFIECNPRGTSGAHLLNNQLAFAFLYDEFVLAKNHQEYSIKYAIALLHPTSMLKKRVLQSKDTIFRLDDLKPFFFQIASLFEITFIKFRKKMTWLEATTADIEWNGY
jgi:predicted ATP-grasp superfamily ATP-dependent carboligase